METAHADLAAVVLTDTVSLGLLPPLAYDSQSSIPTSPNSSTANLSPAEPFNSLSLSAHEVNKNAEALGTRPGTPATANTKNESTRDYFERAISQTVDKLANYSHKRNDKERFTINMATSADNPEKDKAPCSEKNGDGSNPAGFGVHQAAQGGGVRVRAGKQRNRRKPVCDRKA